MGRLKVAVLISGSGSNLQALIDACAGPKAPAEIVLVISNRPEAGGLARADEAGIPSLVVPHRNYSDRASFDAEINRRLQDAGTELVCLAGFMRLFTAAFVELWRDRMINIHPALLPAFKGLHVHERVLESGCRFTGCTVHVVRHEMDAGPIVVQAVVPVRGDDTPESLSARVLAEEHRIYPLALRMFAEGRVRIEGDRVSVEGAVTPAAALVNPGLDA
ncbi:MAG: phosphoribosylglycinamide formyltransferase [Proteobacteria bacterium]|nr:phosphoribosylglycinamide formyltransferase [Pseudomonadota bacterium]MBI3495815.1 phosphoribosylglycinamide formyltransferase [Pseudomonadota bacterium]